VATIYTNSQSGSQLPARRSSESVRLPLKQRDAQLIDPITHDAALYTVLHLEISSPQRVRLTFVQQPHPPWCSIFSQETITHVSIPHSLAFAVPSDPQLHPLISKRRVVPMVIFMLVLQSIVLSHLSAQVFFQPRVTTGVITEPSHTLNPKFRHSATARPTHTTSGPVTASKSLPLRSRISLLRYMYIP
jgi:hypothetical protein